MVNGCSASVATGTAGAATATVGTLNGSGSTQTLTLAATSLVQAGTIGSFTCTTSAGRTLHGAIQYGYSGGQLSVDMEPQLSSDGTLQIMVTTSGFSSVETVSLTETNGTTQSDDTESDDNVTDYFTLSTGIPAGTCAVYEAQAWGLTDDGDENGPASAEGWLTVCAPGPPPATAPTVAVHSVSWGGSTLAVVFKMNADWTTDQLDTEGTTQIVNPVWKDASNGQPAKSDPVAFQVGETMASVFGIQLSISPASAASAVLRVSASLGPNQRTLTFPDADVAFDAAGAATVGGSLTSSQAMPGSIANINATLNWSISFDDGATFSQFASTPQKIFLTLAAPMGFAGGGNVPGAPTITAVRLSRATADLAGGVDPVSSAMLVQASFQQRKIPLSSPSYVDLGPSATNAWAVWDYLAQAQLTGLDCISQTTAVTVELLMAGVNAGLALAYPTVTANQAGTQVIAFIDPSDGSYLNAGIQSDLYYLLGNASFAFPQQFEAYFYLCSAGGTVGNAQTVAPRGGPYNESAGVTESCNVSPQRLAFSIITVVLSSLQATASNANGGRQWWLDYTTGVPVFGPVAFPPGFNVK